MDPSQIDIESGQLGWHGWTITNLSRQARTIPADVAQAKEREEDLGQAPEEAPGRVSKQAQEEAPGQAQEEGPRQALKPEIRELE